MIGEWAGWTAAANSRNKERPEKSGLDPKRQMWCFPMTPLQAETLDIEPATVHFRTGEYKLRKYFETTW